MVDSRPSTGASSVASSRPSTGSSSIASSRPSTAGSSEASSRASSATSRIGSARSTRAWESEETITEDLEEGVVDNHDEDKKPIIVEDENIIDNLLESGEEVDKGCWNRVFDHLTSLWQTNLMENSDIIQVQVKTTIRELTIYMLFMIVTVTMVARTDMNSRFHLTQKLREQFSGFMEIQQVPDLWEYILDNNKGLISSLYEEEYYNNGDDVKYMCPGMSPDECYIDGKNRYTCKGPCKRKPIDQNLLYENKILGVPRIRQLRVRNDTCSITEIFKESIPVCFARYSKSAEDHSNFGPNNKKFTHADAWRYQTASELEGVDYWGELSTYGGGGAVQTLSVEKQQSKAIIRELREYLWISRATRLIMIDFTVYNANLNLFSLAKLTAEFPPTGGLVMRSEFSTVKLLRYVNFDDYIQLAFEATFIFFIIYYVFEEALEISSIGVSYFKNPANYVDLLVIAVSVVNIAITVYVHLKIGSLLKPLLAEPEIFGDFTVLGQWSQYQDSIFATNAFICMLKIFKYITFNKTMHILSDTLIRCTPDLLTFSIMYLIVEFAFIQLGYILFGQKLQGFSSMKESSYSMIRCLLGDFDFNAMSNANIFGSLYFFMYIFLAFFILLNMFLAIINDTYSEVKEELEDASIRYEVTDFFANGYNNIRGTFTLRDKLVDAETAIKIANSEGNITMDKLRSELKKCNFSSAEIDLFFSAKDADGDGIISAKEGNDAVEDLQNDVEFQSHYDGDKPPEDIVTNAEFEIIELRVAKIEQKMMKVVDKIGIAIQKIESWTYGEEMDESQLNQNLKNQLLMN